MQLRGITTVLHVKMLIVINLFTYFCPALTWHVDINTHESAIKERKNTTVFSKQGISISPNQVFNETLRNGNETIPKLRTKRQSGGGKYADAAQMSQVKVLRLWLQMFANSWSKVYVGGAHPLHHNVPKPVVFLFKEKIGDFFFPKLED